MIGVLGNPGKKGCRDASGSTIPSVSNLSRPWYPTIDGPEHAFHENTDVSESEMAFGTSNKTEPADSVWEQADSKKRS